MGSGAARVRSRPGRLTDGPLEEAQCVVGADGAEGNTDAGVARSAASEG
jgi:hypothetical protein